MDYRALVNQAIIRVGVLEENQEFTLKSLFTGIEWDKLKVGEKRNFGRYFKNEILENKIPNVIIVPSNNTPTTYKKIK